MRTLRHRLSANLLDHLHDGPNSGRWLLELDVVVALVGEHLTAIGRQLDQLGLLELPLFILALATLSQPAREDDEGHAAQGRDSARLRETLLHAPPLVDRRLKRADGH